MWMLIMARSEAEVAAEPLQTALALEADVGRRLKVGEIARSDLLLAQQETASARPPLPTRNSGWYAACNATGC